MVLRLDQEGRPYNEGEQVVIGGNERCFLCRKHYKEALSEGSLTRVQSKHRPANRGQIILPGACMAPAASSCRELIP